MRSNNREDVGTFPRGEFSDYFYAMYTGAINALKGFSNTIAHPLDQVVFPVCGLLHDAHVAIAGNPRVRALDPFSLAIRPMLDEHPHVYVEAVARMQKREEAIAQLFPAFLEASGPKKVEIITEVATAIVTISGSIKCKVYTWNGPLKS